MVKESRTTNPQRQSPFGLFLRIEPLRVERRIRGQSGEVVQQFRQLGISVKRPAETDCAGVEHRATLGPLPVNHVHQGSLFLLTEARVVALEAGKGLAAYRLFGKKCPARNKAR